MGVSTGWQTTIEANPEPITIRTSQTAVMVVDMQNDFCSKGGMFDRAGINIWAAEKAVATTRKVHKRRFSGFYETELDDILRRLGIRNLIFTGCTTSVCVDSTIRDAMFRDYRCVLLADRAGEPIGNELPRSNHEASLLTIETLFGWVSDSERFASALQAVGPWQPQ